MKFSTVLQPTVLNPSSKKTKKDLDADSDDSDSEMTTLSMRKRVQEYAEFWLSLAPDDMELAHRYFIHNVFVDI